MENINKQQGLEKIGELPGEIKENENENSSEDMSALEKNNSKKLKSKEKSESGEGSQISKKLDDLGKKLDLDMKQSEDESVKKDSEKENEKDEDNEKDKSDEGAEEAEEFEEEEVKNESKSISNSQYQEIKEANFNSILEYYAELRKVYNEKNQYKDSEFSDIKNFFGSEDFEDDDEDSMTEITNEEYIKQLTEALQIMEERLKEKKLKFDDLMSNVVQKRKIAGIFYECISIEDFNDQFKSINIVLSDLKLSCLCSKYSIPNELRLIDKNKLSKDIEKQEKGILKFDEDDEEEDEYN